MNEPSIIEPRPARRYLSGLAFLGGVLAATFIQSALKMDMTMSAASLVGILVAAVLHQWLERDIPRSVDIITSQATQLPENRLAGLRDYLKNDS
jgi:hypothetical protein